MFILLPLLLLAFCGLSDGAGKPASRRIQRAVFGNNSTAVGRNDTDTYIPGTYMVRINPNAKQASTPAGHINVAAPHIGFRPRIEFSNSKFFYGVSLTLDDESQLEALNKTDGVEDVWKVALVPRPGPVGSVINQAGAIDLVSTSTSTIAINSTANITLPNYRGKSNVNAPLQMGNVQALHDKGIKGKGIQIGLVDSGVDYRHPALGGGFGPGFKIALGYDFVGDNYTGDNNPTPGGPPLTTCPSGGHGTHCAGILAMEDPPKQGFGLVGVAPEATLAVYRVFGCEGGAATDVIISAIITAAEDGADVISLSVGSEVLWEKLSGYAGVPESLVDNGIAFIVANGNDGESDGVYSVDDPAVDPSSFAVGSIENEVFPTVYQAHSSKGETLDYLSLLPYLDSKTKFDVYLLGTGLGVPVNSSLANGCSVDAWNAAKKANRDWNTTMLVMQYDQDCNPLYYLAELGIHTVIFLMANDYVFVETTDPGADPVFLFLTYPSSQTLWKDLTSSGADQSTYRIQFDGTTVVDAKNGLGGITDPFSSYGPTIEMTLKPQLSAPGGNILSTWPLGGGGYQVESGTSMATPFVAGCYALLKSQHPEYTVAQALAVLQSTAQPIKALESSLLASTAQQGGGIVDAYAAVIADTVVSPSQLNLRDSTQPKAQKITIENTSGSAKTYTISHRPASYVRHYPNWGDGNIEDPLDTELVENAIFADAVFSAKSLTIPAHGYTTVTVQLKPPHEPQPESQPVYSGFIDVVSGSTNASIPYIGVPFSRYQAGPIVHNDQKAIGIQTPLVQKATYPPIADNGTGTEKITPSSPNIDTYNLTLDEAKQFNQSNPVITLFLMQPCEFSRLELVPANTSFVPDFYGFDRSVKINYQHPTLSTYSGFLDVETYGVLEEVGLGDGPVDPNVISQNLEPALYEYFEMGAAVLGSETGNDINVTSGDYRPLLRALRYGGDNTNPTDYQSWLGPVWRIKIF